MSQRYLLDTNILLWWLRADDRLPKRHHAALEAEVAHQRPLALRLGEKVPEIPPIN